MATRVDAWRSDDGSLHPSEREAAKHNVRLIANKLKSNRVGESLTEALTQRLIEYREDIMRVLTGYHRCHPADRPSDPTPEAPYGDRRIEKNPALAAPYSGDIGPNINDFNITVPDYGIEEIFVIEYAEQRKAGNAIIRVPYDAYPNWVREIGQ